MQYFSEKENGESPRETEEIGDNAWKGILAKIRIRVADGSFGASYPDVCPDGNYVAGTNERLLDDTIRAELPGLAAHEEGDHWRGWQSILDILDKSDSSPSTLDILDLIEFCWKSVAEPSITSNHSYFGHAHLTFDQDAGREKFQNEVEIIFRRNGIAYVLTEEGRIERLTPPVFHSALVESDFDTGDAELNRLLTTAQRKFLDPHPDIRREATEALWDAWERLKTLGDEADKKAQVKVMLDATAGENSPTFRDALEREAMEITKIGNSLRIRHSETNQEQLERSDHVDYLFYRLFSLIRLILLAKPA